MNIDLRQGDCLELLKDIPDNSIDLVLTDPPYKLITGGMSNKTKNNTSGIFNKDPLKNKWVNNSSSCLVKEGKIFKHNNIKFKDWLNEVFRILKNGTHCYIMVNDRNMKELLNESEKSGFKLVNILFWNKGNVTPNRYYMKAGEFILLFRKGKAKPINNMGSKTILDYKNIIGKKTHPTEKPVDLLEHLILNSSNENDIILDPFIGTGSCAVACKNLNRNFIGFELDEEYFNIAKKRIENEHN